MKFSLVALANLLLVGTALASPVGSKVIAPRDDYANNWAGAVVTAAPAGQTFTRNVASFTVPTPTPAASGPGTWSGSAWVGIDGYSCRSSTLQSGVTWSVTVDDEGNTSYDYQGWWIFGSSSGVFEGLPVAAGNPMVATVVSSSSTEATVYLENDYVTQVQRVPVTSTEPLCGTNAEWIIEDMSSNPLANFGTIQFTGAVASASGGSFSSTDGATIVNIESADGKTDTDTTINDTPVLSEVTIKWLTD